MSTYTLTEQDRTFAQKIAGRNRRVSQGLQLLLFSKAKAGGEDKTRYDAIMVEVAAIQAEREIEAAEAYAAANPATPILALPAATGTPEERRATLERAFDSNAERLAYNYGAMRVDPAITAIQAALTDAISDQWHEAVERRADWLAAA